MENEINNCNNNNIGVGVGNNNGNDWFMVLVYVSAGFFLISMSSYLIPLIILKFMPVQNLKKKYNAKWALVTGGSSGIGKAIVEKLASQDLNVVIVAVPDKLLEASTNEMRSKFPKLQFISVGVDLSKPDHMNSIIEATKDLDITIVFSNAGYIKTGFFTNGPVEAQLANHNVNATATVTIANYFVREMQNKRLPGCICFTSSPAGFMPCPFSVLYGATKAFVTEFAVSLAAEIKSDGIDVCVVHPSPVASNFYQGAHQLDALMFFKSTATGPEAIANALFSTVGRSTVCDQGYYPPVVRIILKIIDIALLGDIIAFTASSLGDFKKVKNELHAESIAPIKVQPKEN